EYFLCRYIYISSFVYDFHVSLPYRRNMTICLDSNQSNRIYIVKTGQCRILKDIELKAKYGKSTSGKGGRPETRVQYYYFKSNNIRSKRSKVQPFPKVEELESKLSIYREWKLYRNRLLEESFRQLHSV
uniref:Uncharacterized protein n=1 Tax=Trichobilharzia regenti TaxID=157069 RepID=A0AA85J7B1_TRIRE